LTKARINVQFLEKGFIDPMLANSVSQLALLSSYYSLSPHKFFKILDPDGSGDIAKPEFMAAMQGMELNLTLEEILELFNFMDDKQVNRVTEQQFVDSASFLLNKLGGPTLLESSATARSILETRKGVPNKQLVFKILGEICETLQKEQFTIRQLMVIMDRNKTGYLSR
jgi:Ca2+-binding EF-hand superfamily protein